jgi:predicted transcriptional regulator
MRGSLPSPEKSPASSTIRVSRQFQSGLRKLAEQEGESMQRILEKALERYRRERKMRLFNEAYASLRCDPKAWQEELREREIWDAALLDGLESDQW